MKIYIAVPNGYAPALPVELTPARIIYRVRGARLYSARGNRATRGGVMVIGASGYTGGAPSSALIGEIVSEVAARDYEGVVLDAGDAASPLQIALANELTAAIAPKRLFVPEPIGRAVADAGVLIQTALSGGSLERHLAGALEHFGPRVALECDRIRMDFTLPAYGGAGAELSAEALEELLRTHSPGVFRSDALCVNYFTYRDGAKAHIVLFDDVLSIRRKLELAEALGIGAAFLFYPHVSDLLSEL
ncbi:MAG: hypothetical protein LBN99_04090 [Oscillospiraceae bacterium]|jgi:hypothetical protein|nr:hypothetical protein [Oscillospiraceae bacterium]